MRLRHSALTSETKKRGKNYTFVEKSIAFLGQYVVSFHITLLVKLSLSILLANIRELFTYSGDLAGIVGVVVVKIA